jgi:signal transduction histidine kinase
MLNLLKARMKLSISRKLLFLVLLTSTIGTTITSIVQIIFEYGVAKDVQQSELEVFSSTAVPSLQNLVWSFNETSLSEQLHSALAPEDFIGIKVTNEKDVVQAQFRKEKKYKNIESASYKLKNPTNEAEVIGSVILEYTNDFIITNLKQKVMVIILLNLIKTFIISTILLIIFRIHVVNRLVKLAEFLKKQDWNRPELFTENHDYWPFTNFKDEFSDIDEALNKATATIHNNIDLLEKASCSSARLAELGTLSAGIAHEINNPLNIISGFAYVLNRHVQGNDVGIQKLGKCVSGITIACKRIANIISGMKYFSRDGSNDVFIDCKVQKLINEIKPVCEGALISRGIELKFNVEPEEMCLYCRPVQLAQILLNLINNAVDAIENLESKWIQICFFLDADGSPVITVTDSGSGIPTELQTRIFVPFFTTKDVGKGAGLGLSIAHGIVMQHGGTIAVNNACINTQFIIKFPKLEVNHAA